MMKSLVFFLFSNSLVKKGIRVKNGKNIRREEEEEDKRRRVFKAGNNNVRLIRSECNANAYGTTGLLMS